jgi:rhodanese-related sulfurtransferase
MAKTFMQMAAEAQAEVAYISPREAQACLQEDPNVLLIDVRDAHVIRATGRISGSIPISAGSLLFKADQEVPEEWRDSRLQDRSRPVLTQCDLGALSAISAKNLKDMGFSNVRYIEGGLAGWKDAGLPTESASD